MPRVTASGLSMLRYCAAPFRDDAPVLKERKPGLKTRSGSAVHTLNELAALGVQYQPEDAIVKHEITPTWRAFVYGCHTSWLKWYEAAGRPALRPEVAYEFDTATGDACEIVLQSPRDYPYRDGCVYGTADAVFYDGESVRVTDYKTGDPAYYDKASRNAQMLFLSMCAAKVAGVADAIAELQFIETDRVTPDTAEYDYFVLADFEQWLCSRYRDIANAEHTRGDWCRDKWCKLRPTKDYPGCPAWAPQQQKEEQ